MTIFSLYITIFDFLDPKRLDSLKLPLLKNSNFICSDFFNDDAIKEIVNIHFDYIIGNPPWGNIKQDGYKNYCKINNIDIPDKEICIAFLSKIHKITFSKTICSIIIPSKILYKVRSLSIKFRKEFLLNNILHQVFETAAVRHQLFNGAVAPAAVLTFSPNCNSNESKCTLNKVEFISLKPNVFLKSFNMIMIEPDDIKYIFQNILIEHDSLWKILIYGTRWDFDLILRLKNNYKNIESIVSENDFLLNNGLQDNLGDENDSSAYIGRKMLDPDTGIEHFYVNESKNIIFEKSKIHRPRNSKIFRGPYVLFKKGLDLSNFSIRAAFYNQDLLYTDTIACIKGKEKDINALLNIEGLLNSSLFSYFNLLLTSCVGIEREQIFLEEISRYPHVYSNKIVTCVKKIKNLKSKGNNLTLHSINQTNELINGLDQIILNEFKITKREKYFIDYINNYTIPILSGRYEYKRAEENQVRKYVDVFIDIWNESFSNDIKLNSEIKLNIKGKYTAIIFTLIDKDNLQSNLSGITDAELSLMVIQINDQFLQMKNLIKFNDNQIYIVKSNEDKNWQSASAVKDCLKVINSILLGRC